MQMNAAGGAAAGLTDHSFQIQILLSDSGVDEQLGSILKSFYKINRPDAIIEQLNLTILKKEQEIERLCNRNYQSFVSSVDHLLSVREDADLLKQRIVDFDREFQESGRQFIEMQQNLDSYRQVKQNIDKAVETIRTCIYILELISKINLQIEHTQYYNSLKTLDEVQHLHLSQIMNFEFAKQIQAYIPQVHSNIKSIVLAELKDWFVNIREISRKIGRNAIQQIKANGCSDGILGFVSQPQSAKQVASNPKDSPVFVGVTKSASSSRQNKGPTRSLSASKSVELVLNEEAEVDSYENDDVPVNFRPLYQSLHIHETLGQRNFIKTHYAENRQLQANLILNATFSLNEQELSAFESYLCDITGFFLIENQVAATTDRFRSRAAVDALWESTMSKLYDTIAESLQNCENPDYFLGIKELMIAFIQTMEAHQFAVSKLVELLMTFFERYSELTKSRASLRCHQAIEIDDGNPLAVHSPQEYRELLDNYGYKETPGESTAIAAARFPKTFPFSASLIDCLKEIREFIAKFYQFGDGFHQHFAEMADMIKKAVQFLVTKDIIFSIEEKIDANNIQLSEVVRIILNMEHFERAIVEIENLLEERRIKDRLAKGHYGTYNHPAPDSPYQPPGSPWRRQPMAASSTSASPSPSKSPTKQVASSIGSSLAYICQGRFRDARKKAENRIFELINSKIDDMIDMTCYEWVIEPRMAPSPTKRLGLTLHNSTMSARNEPSSYLMDLITFLTTVWTSTLAELPATTKSFVYYDAIYHISSVIIQGMLDADVKKISPFYIDTVMQRDLQFLEEFVKSLDDPNLMEQLAELKQTIKLLQSDTNVEEYLQPSVKSKVYSRVSKSNALCLLEKVRESGAWIEQGGGFLFGIGSGSSPSKDGSGGTADGKKHDKAAKRKSLELVIKTLKEELKH